MKPLVMTWVEVILIIAMAIYSDDQEHKKP